MRKIYLFPGLGADRRLFDNFHIEGYDLIYVEWIEPLEDEKFQEYLIRLSRKYHIENNAILIGVSLGGIAVVELSQILDPALSILISSIKNSDESPWFYRIINRLKLHKILPFKVFKHLPQMGLIMNGVKTDGGKHIFKDMLLDVNDRFYDWSVDQFLNWEFKESNIKKVHIHGLDDKIFPVKHIKSDFIPITGGTHFMIYEKAEEINNIVLSIISNL